jgi:hypothetical protein
MIYPFSETETIADIGHFLLQMTYDTSFRPEACEQCSPQSAITVAVCNFGLSIVSPT